MLLGVTRGVVRSDSGSFYGAEIIGKNAERSEDQGLLNVSYEMGG